MTTKFKTVLFDLDGTIMDTNELIIQSFLHALKGIVPADFGREHIIPSMGLPLTDQMKQFSGIEEVTQLVAAYREVNLRLHDDYVSAFPYVQEVMARLHAEGIQIGIVTTKMRLTTSVVFISQACMNISCLVPSSLWKMSNIRSLIQSQF